jgi:hypothetical protein
METKTDSQRGWMRELFLAEPFTVVVEALPRDFKLDPEHSKQLSENI